MDYVVIQRHYKSMRFHASLLCVLINNQKSQELFFIINLDFLNQVILLFYPFINQNCNQT